VAIVDDVMTTGSTLDAAASAMLSAGALRVDAWVVARTLRNQESVDERRTADGCILADTDT
jgi:adenine/guanine phosphoribosyltransferase-like PRPP-binding protein